MEIIYSAVKTKLKNRIVLGGIFNPVWAAIFLITVLYSCQKEVYEKNVTVSNSNASRSVKQSQPNVILFLADDLGYEIPGYTGGESYSTPNLDFMATNGLRFGNAYSNPDGFPSRLSLYTGKYNFRNYYFWGQMLPKEKTIGNLMHDAGYATCFVGKWQCDGGGDRVEEAGYDKYRIFLPFALSGDVEFRYEYKNPVMYENGDYISSTLTAGKYSEDLYTDYIKDFIDSNKNHPFFAVYAHNLPRTPWQPTPDDPDFAAWDPLNLTNEMGDIKYFPGMVNYLDKKIGQVLQKLRDDSLENNTIILFCADNSTNKGITSIFQGNVFTGGKNLTSRKGIRTPLFAYWPGTIAPGRIDTFSLVDYTDFLPTLADIAGVPEPQNYGTLDGVTFYDNMLGVTGPQKPWSFCQWDNSTNDDTPPIRYVYSLNYKLYDTVSGGSGLFYNTVKDVFEKKPITDDKLTKKQAIIKNSFKEILSQMHN